MPRSPPPPNPSIVNTSNLLPSVNVLFDEVRQRERASSHSSSGSRTPSAWSGFPGPERALIGHGNSRPQLPPLQVGHRMAPQQQQMPPVSRPGTERYLANSESPPHVHAQAPLPVIPNRMGGRYAQTPCHSNGQPHAAGLMPISPNRASSAHSSHRRPRALTTGSSRPAPSTNGREVANEAASRLFHSLLESAGNPTCAQCVHDLRIESRRQVVGTHGPAFSQFAHGIKPQHPTALPQVQGLITIPFTPKPINNQTVLFGVSLTEILDFRDVLDDPRERVLDNSMNKILLTIEHPGYPVVVKQISGNCPHRPVSRFNLAFSVAEAYFSFFKTNQFDPTVVPKNSAVVRSVTQIRLVNLYTTDRTNYRAHVAYVF